MLPGFATTGPTTPLATRDPVALAPIFASLTRGMDESAQRPGRLARFARGSRPASSVFSLRPVQFVVNGVAALRRTG